MPQLFAWIFQKDSSTPSVCQKFSSWFSEDFGVIWCWTPHAWSRKNMMRWLDPRGFQMNAHKNILLLAPIQENFWKFTCFLFEWAQNRRAAKHFPSLSKSVDSKVKQLASKCSKVNEFERVIHSSKAYKLGSRPAALSALIQWLSMQWGITCCGLFVHVGWCMHGANVMWAQMPNAHTRTRVY